MRFLGIFLAALLYTCQVWAADGDLHEDGGPGAPHAVYTLCDGKATANETEYCAAKQLGSGIKDYIFYIDDIGPDQAVPTAACTVVDVTVYETSDAAADVDADTDYHEVVNLTMAGTTAFHVSVPLMKTIRVYLTTLTDCTNLDVRVEIFTK